MYLHRLEKDEKTVFLDFARYLATLQDNKIDAQEQYMLRYMRAEMGLPQEEDKRESSFEAQKVLNVFYRDEAKRILIVEGVGVALANGIMMDQQKALLDELAQKLLLPEGFVQQAEQVVRKQLQIMGEFDALVQA